MNATNVTTNISSTTKQPSERRRGLSIKTNVKAGGHVKGSGSPFFHDHDH